MGGLGCSAGGCRVAGQLAAGLARTGLEGGACRQPVLFRSCLPSMT